ncbi:MAG TPA: accessory factor UbiK family protein [Caulobacteraceae bacterium]
MQTQNPLLDEISKLTTAAVGLAQAAGDEAKAAMRAQLDRLAVEMDFVRRDEFEAARAEIALLREEIAHLKSEREGPARSAQEAG